MLEIPAFVKEFLWIVAHTKTVFIKEILNTERSRSDQKKSWTLTERSLRLNVDLFSRGAEDAEVSVNFMACAGLHLAAHSLGNSLSVNEQLAFPSQPRLRNWQGGGEQIALG